MKKIISLMLSVAILSTGSIVNISQAEESQNIIYVSVNTGNDYYDGSLNKPLKTIEAARNKAREIEGNVTIEIMGGEYVFTSPFELSEADSNVTYKAYSNEKPVIKGSVSIPTEKANKVTDTGILDKLNENVKEEVYVIDLIECGLNGRDIVDCSLANHQYGISAYKSNFNTFYIDGKPMEVAQWPNGRDYAQHLGANDTTSIIYDGNYPDRWAGAKDWWVGLWIPYDYAYYTFGGVGIDAGNNILEYVNNPVVEYQKNTYSRRWKAFNLIEELDVPGEYFIDRTNMMLYFYPGEAVTNQKFEIDVNLEKIISIQNAKNITFDGIEFSNTNGSAIKATDVENVDVINCTFKNIGYNALYFTGSEKATTGCYKNGELWWQYQQKNGSYDVDIKGNIFNNIGCSAISMGGAGDVDTLTSSRNYIENNIIYNAGFKSVIHALDIGGCGVTIRHNNISRLSTGAITMLGNNHLVEYNEIYDAITEAVDAGAIYQGGSDIFRGTVVQYNYIHDIKKDNNKTYNDIGNGLCGIYWDEGQQGMTSNNNILVNIPIAFNSNYAGNFSHKYNITVDCESKWNLHDADLRKWPIVTKGYAGTLAEIAEMITNKELYYATYSNLEEYITKGTNPKKWTVIEKNLSVNCDGAKVGSQEGWYSTIENNKDTTDKSIFVNPSIQDYRLLKSSAISQEIPELINEDFNLDLIGIQTNSSFGDELSEFDVIYPKNNESIDYSDEYTFVWEPSLGANQYKIVVAKDKDFTQVIYSKETVQTQATVTGLSDNTVYYWKVEAKNISRELSSQWQTKGAPVKFAVGGLYNDSVAQNIPENMILVAADCESFDVETNGDLSILGYNFKWSINTGYKNYGYQYMATELAPETWYRVGPLGKGKKTIDHDSIEVGKSYVISAWVKDARTTEDVERTEFSVSMKYDLPAGGDKNIFTKEYPEGMPMELTDSWQQFSGSIKIPEDYGSFSMLEFGVPTTNEFIVGQGFRVDELYLAEEAPYEIKLETDNNKITLGSEIEVNASVLNQVGKKGYLNHQELDWFVTDLDRKEIINGFQITETTDGVKVLAPLTVKSGKYVLIAKLNDILKGIEIEVSNDFSDKLGVKPDNLIIKGVDCSNQNAETDKDFTRIGYNFDFDVIASGYSGNTYRFMANTTGATTAYKVGPVGKGLSHMSGDFEKGKNYVISAWVKDARTTEAVPFTEFSAAVMNDGWNNIWSGTKITLSNEWQQYADTFTTPENYTSLKFLQFGAPTESTFSVGQGFLLDELYVAEEAPYEIKLETDDNKITLGSEIEVNASLLNQGGKKGHLKQEFEWFVTDENRKEIIDGFQITETTDGVKVLAPLTVKTGKYVLISKSNDILKGIEIEVSNDFSDKLGVKPDNLIIKGVDCSNQNAETDKDFTRIGYNFDFDVIASGYSGNAYRFMANTTGATTAYKVGPVGKGLSHMSGDFEKGKKYVISAWVKDARTTEAVPFTEFSAAVMNDGWNNIWSGTKITLSNEWQQYADTFTTPENYTSLKFLQFGAPTENTHVVGQGFMLDDLYVAEEVPYDIAFYGDTKIIKGETINIQAELLNQVGKKSSFSKEFQWFITDLDRKHGVDGFDIQETQNGVSISVADNVATGKYSIVAVAGDIRKGIVIDVLSDFNDTQTPALPENKIPDARAGLESNDSWGGGNGYYADKWKYVGNFAGKKGQSMRFTAQETGGTYVATMGIAPFQMMVSNGSMYQNFEKDKDYVISIWVKDSKASDDIPYTKFSTLFRYINQNEESINIFTKEITLTNQWQQYADTVTLPSDFLSAGTLRIGSREENPMPGQSFMVDELYVAEEIPYSMNIKGNGTISTGESAKFEASIRNQVGAEGNLKQDFSWYALDSNRESFVDGITITENQDGTVNVLADNTVSTGDYTIVAVAEEYNFVKGFVVTVNKKPEAISTLNFERTGNDVNLVATVENAEAERILFVIAEFNGTTLEKVTSVTKGKNDANCDLTLKGVKTGNTIKAFIWNMGTLIPIDNPKNFNMSYLVE